MRLLPAILIALGGGQVCAQSALVSGFQNPPSSAKTRAYWWWLNGNVTKESIRNDLQEMAAKGFGGALICDANGANQFGNAPVPHGPTFLTKEWHDLYKFTLEEANKLHLEMSLNIQSGWNLGGPMVPANDAPKKLVFSSVVVDGSQTKLVHLDEPKHNPNLYADVTVVAYPVRPGGDGKLDHFEEKALIKGLSWSAPDSSLLFLDREAKEGEEATEARDVVDVSNLMTPSGDLAWTKPGKWRIVRIGYTLNDHCRVSTNSDGWDGYAIDPFDRGAFMRYWNAVVEPLIQDAGPYAGNTLKYLHTDSWEVEVANWTPSLRQEFRKRRGYDMWPYLPVMFGAIVDSRDRSNRFLNDLRRTIGDLAIDNHFRLFRDLAHKHGLEIHPESGGPHAVPIDSLQCLGMNDAPMSEFWAGSWTHRVKDEDRFFVKQPATAAHTYGHNLVLAEGFTTIGPHWQETLWDNLKPNFDEACCQGLNRLVWHAFVCSPESTGMPGQQYFAGTHLNPKVTWWEYSSPFFDYLNRCQFMLQQGKFVADALYYYGNHVPNFTQLEASDPAKVRPGYDYDVATEEVILKRLDVKDGRLVLPDGMSYRILVLPDRKSISLPVLRKIRDLVRKGAKVFGPKPTQGVSLFESDSDVQKLSNEMWGSGAVQPLTEGRKALSAMGVKPDFSWKSNDKLALNYIHRRTAKADIYFIANRSPNVGSAVCEFRQGDLMPEQWDPISGKPYAIFELSCRDGITTIPIKFGAYGSTFIVWPRSEGESKVQVDESSSYVGTTTLQGPWKVSFDTKWGGPGEVEFPELIDWSLSPIDGIRYYSGRATYQLDFDAPKGVDYLDLGQIRELARVKLNGKDLGTVWAPPFRVDIRRAIRGKGNHLEVEVVNFWPNRIIGDARNPNSPPFTRTNILGLKADSKLMPSGLMGPVQLLSRAR